MAFRKVILRDFSNDTTVFNKFAQGLNIQKTFYKKKDFVTDAVSRDSNTNEIKNDNSKDDS